MNINEKSVRTLLGRNIKRLRLHYGLTQEVLAEKADISANFLSNVETGKVWVSPKTIANLANVFRVAPHELFMPPTNAEPSPPDSREVLLQYSQELRKLIKDSFDMVEERYITQSGS